jgi:hypothetical protein
MYAPIRASVSPCHPYAKNGWTYAIIARAPLCHTIRQNGWTYAILARDRYATQYAKMDGLMPFLHATEMLFVLQNGQEQSERRYLHANIRQNGWTYAILAYIKRSL